MKRKKWSELEEQTLLTKYSDLLTSGTLFKLKTREKKFRPIAEHVNSVHHLQDPVNFPFKWSWRDVSIKVQNMRHQYLGVKQKIKISNDEFNWKDGENHWENFLKYKEVFGDVELEVKNKKSSENCSGDLFKDCGDLGFGIDSEDLDEEEEEDEEEDGDNGNDDNINGAIEEETEFVGEKSNGEMVTSKKAKAKKGNSGNRRLGLLGAQVMDLRDAVVRREEKRRENEFNIEKCTLEREEKRGDLEVRREAIWNEREERLEKWEMELEERELLLSRREMERKARVEREMEEERKKRRKMEEKREEEEMEWRERMMVMQIEHEKAMMQIQADACQNQMHILGLMGRVMCQFFGPNDGLGGGLAGLPPQVLQNLDPGGLGDSVKPDVNSPSEFL